MVGSMLRKKKAVVNYKDWLVGDTEIPKSAPWRHRKRFATLRNRVARVAAHSGHKFTVNSGYRTYAEQAALYDKYLHHGGNLAAKPGTSNHEGGSAMDVSDRGKPIGARAENRKAMRHLGLCLPVHGEAWHVEQGNTWRA